MSSLDVVATGAAADAVAAHVPTLVADRVASRLFAQDHTLWGEAAEAESAKRLSWTGLPRTSRHLVGEIEALRDELAETGYDRVVLCGMGGSSLAPEVICATAGVPLVVLDSSDPDVVRGAADRPRAHRRRRVEQVRLHRRDRQPAPGLRAGVHATPASTRRPGIVVVTDPGSPLDGEARAAGYRVVNADPDVGGRYSALTAFGLVPERPGRRRRRGPARRRRGGRRPARRRRRRQPGAAPRRRDGRHRRRCATSSSSSTTAPRIVGFGDWAEQLIAESTGKDGTGILPVVADRHRARRHLYDDGTVVRLVASDDDADAPPTAVGRPRRSSRVAGPLGAQLLLWEAATAVAGRLLGINPFDQPDVESAKAAARELLDAGIGAGDGPGLHRRRRRGARPRRRLARRRHAPSTAPSTRCSASSTATRGYVAVMAYLDRRGRRRPRARRPRPVRPHRATGHLRLGPALPALDRAVPQGRSGRRASTCRSPRPRREDLAVPGRDFTFGAASSPRRPAATPRCSPSTAGPCCACT